MEDSSVSEWFGDFLHSFLHNPASIRFGGLRQSSCCYLFEGLLPPVRIAGGTPIDRQCSCVFHSVQAVDLKIQEPSRAQVVESFLMLSAIEVVRHLLSLCQIWMGAGVDNPFIRGECDGLRCRLRSDFSKA